LIAVIVVLLNVSSPDDIPSQTCRHSGVPRSGEPGIQAAHRLRARKDFTVIARLDRAIQ
jgi:hypothetical protein